MYLNVLSMGLLQVPKKWLHIGKTKRGKGTKIIAMLENYLGFVQFACILIIRRYF